MSAPYLTRVTLYDAKTGEARSFHPIDARECLARGGWQETPVTEASVPPEKPATRRAKSSNKESQA